MKIKKLFKVSSLFFSTLLFSYISIHVEKNISLSFVEREQKKDKITLFGSSTSNDEDKKEPTEEEIKQAKKMFWIEFGVTAGFLILIIICFVSFIIIKKRKK